MGFMRRIGEGIHTYTWRMKLGLTMYRRAVELQQRGLTKDESEKQAGAEVIQFLR
jgi:hypothetical protein